jgi:hypothetical protein
MTVFGPSLLPTITPTNGGFNLYQRNASFRNCFHVNGYHCWQYVQQHNGWNNRTWDAIDFHTFGRHFWRMRLSLRSQHFKFVHDYLPFGERRFQVAPIKDASLKLCPCCRVEDKTPLHFLPCRSNPAFQSSLDILRSDTLNSDIHPVQYLLTDGFSMHWMGIIPTKL